MRTPHNCNKDGHTYTEAAQIIRKQLRRDRIKGRTIRKQAVYKCPSCGHFHTSSHSYNE